MSENISKIAAIVLAAGESRRMGRPKLSMPWGDTTVIGQVLNVLDQAGVDEAWVVTGGGEKDLQAALRELTLAMTIHSVHNRSYSTGEMTRSVQVGLSGLEKDKDVEAALIVLGDQPQIEKFVVESLLDEYKLNQSLLVVPSYHQRRGHPWIVAQPLWTEILKLAPAETLRVVLNRYADEIHYLNVNTPTVLQDLDTPEDYYKYFPRNR
jgi:molybdenum cofactor cytidylyltransferase